VRAVVQRVERASVAVEGTVVGAIERGLLVLVGVGKEDLPPEEEAPAGDHRANGARAQAAALARNIATLRIFADEAGRSNLSLLDTHGSALVISQFTLYADTKRGRRPSFTEAADPGPAEALVEEFRLSLEGLGVPTAAGRFGAHMTVSLINDGPYTVVLDSAGLDARAQG
jgi:D-tyrosyl-tRNA(Tyr) deacylase